MKKHLLLFALAIFCITGCGKVTKDPVDTELTNTRYYVNAFAYSVMNTYYLWKKEISDAFADWADDDEPINKIEEIRYKGSDGEDIDRWTMLTDDYSSLISSIDGVTTTYGLDYTLYYVDNTKKTVCMIVNYTAEGSPARKAGLKRGDVIMQVGGKELSTKEYATILKENFHYASSCTLTLLDGSKVEMTATEMYEDPVLLYKIFSFNGKKVGYLVYNSFTLTSWERLKEACGYFVQEGVTELILDLRYNSGGYVTAEYTLASMLAPKSAVENQDVFEKNIYNDAVQKALGDTDSRFTDSFNFTYENKEYNYSTADTNVDITKIYAITTSRTASASESILVGLSPYLDMEIIGQSTSGKYCSGMLYPASSWTEDYRETLVSNGMNVETVRKYTDNWGIYVMISRFADRNGNTPCMPDGYVPDIEAEDNPIEGLELGDENEALLHIALQRAGKTDFTRKAPRSPGFTPAEPLRVPSNGYRIIGASLPQYPEFQK